MDGNSDPGPSVDPAADPDNREIWIIPSPEAFEARRHTPEEDATETIRSLHAEGKGIGGSGILMPIVVLWDKVPSHMKHIFTGIALVIDGWSRVLEARRAGVRDEVIARAFTNCDPNVFPPKAETIKLLNKVRRHEHAGARCIWAAREMRRTQVQMTQTEAAKYYHVNERHLRRALNVVDSGPDALIKAGLDERIELKTGVNCAKLKATLEEKAKLVEEALNAPDPNGALAKSIDKFKENQGRKRAADQNVGIARYDLIYVDAPWPQSHELPYETMTIEDIKDLHLGPKGRASRDVAHPTVTDVAAPNTILAFWVTEEFRNEAEPIMRAWDFEPLSPWLIWHKRPGHEGRVAQMCAEFLIIGRRGIAFEPAYKPPQIIRPEDFVEEFGECEPLEDSQKPELFRKLLHKMYPHLTRPIEVFARRSLPDPWEGWGDQYPGKVTKETSTEAALESSPEQDGSANNDP
jgi:N6-adenosine-specific RNA methylase IME4